MSAPHTDVEKQAKRHRPPLTGFIIVVAFALILLVGLIIWMFATGGAPEGADAQMQSGIGIEEVDEAPAAGAEAIAE